MEQIIGEKLDNFPINNLVKVADLIYFDGPILSQFIDRKKRNFLYYWCDCNSSANRWLIFPVLDLDLQDYLEGQRSLYDLIINNELFSNIFVADIDSSLELKSIWEISILDLPDAYIPERESFYEFTPHYRDIDYEQIFDDSSYKQLKSNFEQLKDESYKISLDGRWSLVELSELPQAYNKAYAFLYSLEDGDLFSQQYKSQPWRGGFSSYNFYQRIQHKVPRNHKPEILSIHYSSPGSIELRLLRSVALEIKELTKNTIENRQNLTALYQFIYEELNRRTLLRKNLSAYQEFEQDNLIFVRKSTNDLVQLLGAKYLEKIQILTDDPLITLKILLSFYRIIRDLAAFQLSGKALF